MDAADKLSCRPDFAIVLYPDHLWAHEDEDRATRDKTELSLRTDISVRADSPPTFLLHAGDDHVDSVALGLCRARHFPWLPRRLLPTNFWGSGPHAGT
ncbi:hypothetical protein POL68_01180 [Stigmatella sp. ncwal1]|uniref:Uncharacterized protein n=1 Tax=Stigmatella ashevillensis TaxID=2995309 RepID=A0ABT5D4A7_9BACT|nr:hypothetical protein [Stigmatella ashevillena]MDC0707072.1 hypothetical protein [Stigmatella ashevillena]